MYETLKSKVDSAIRTHGLPEVLQALEDYMSVLHMVDVEEQEEHEIIDRLLHAIGDATEIACKFETLHKTREMSADELREIQLRRKAS